VTNRYVVSADGPRGESADSPEGTVVSTIIPRGFGRADREHTLISLYALRNVKEMSEEEMSEGVVIWHEATPARDSLERLFLHRESPVMLLAFGNLHKRRDRTIQRVGDGAEQFGFAFLDQAEWAARWSSTANLDREVFFACD
jgi:hypothetical protein